MATRETFTGLNIQYPISQTILNGTKTVETRTYPLPNKHVEKPMLIVETPGKTGKFKARIVAKVTFGPSFQYKSKSEFRKDVVRHCVEEGSEWDWKDKPKWGWPIQKIELINPSIESKKRIGIVYTNCLSI